MQKRPLALRLMLPIVMLLVLACGPCNLLSSTPPTPPHPIVVSTESAEQFESRLGENLRGAPGQEFILRVTDAELTSWLASELADYDEPPVVDPQVWFTKGKIHGSGRVTNLLPIESDFFVVASARIEDGKVIIEVEEASAGSLPVPAGALDTLSQSISQTVDELQLGVEVTALEILEGEAIVQGLRE